MEAVLLGATASGKSEVAGLLAAASGGCIVAADSRTVYRGFSIGTAKTGASIQTEIPHFNIDVLDPMEADSPARFRERLNVWQAPARFPEVWYCGGGTLYLQEILFDRDLIPERNAANTRFLEAITAQRGKEAVLGWLRTVDPEYARRVDGFNPVRIYRALDVWMQSGRPFSSFHTMNVGAPKLRAVFGLQWQLDALRERIRSRTRQMFESGLVEEVTALAARIPLEAPAFRTVGYAEVLEGLAQGWPHSRMEEAVFRNTAAYARRQITWFRRWPFINWIPAEGRSAGELAADIRAKMGNLG